MAIAIRLIVYQQCIDLVMLLAFDCRKVISEFHLQNGDNGIYSTGWYKGRWNTIWKVLKTVSDIYQCLINGNTIFIIIEHKKLKNFW